MAVMESYTLMGETNHDLLSFPSFLLFVFFLFIFLRSFLFCLFFFMFFPLFYFSSLMSFFAFHMHLLVLLKAGIVRHVYLST